MENWQKDLLKKVGLSEDLNAIISRTVEYTSPDVRNGTASQTIRGVAFGGGPEVLSFDIHAETRTILFLCLNRDDYYADAHSPLPALAFDGIHWTLVEWRGHWVHYVIPSVVIR